MKLEAGVEFPLPSGVSNCWLNIFWFRLHQPTVPSASLPLFVTRTQYSESQPINRSQLCDWYNRQLTKKKKKKERNNQVLSKAEAGLLTLRCAQGGVPHSHPWASERESARQLLSQQHYSNLRHVKRVNKIQCTKKKRESTTGRLQPTLPQFNRNKYHFKNVLGILTKWKRSSELSPGVWSRHVCIPAAE